MTGTMTLRCEPMTYVTSVKTTNNVINEYATFNMNCIIVAVTPSNIYEATLYSFCVYPSVEES